MQRLPWTRRYLRLRRSQSGYRLVKASDRWRAWPRGWIAVSESAAAAGCEEVQDRPQQALRGSHREATEIIALRTGTGRGAPHWLPRCAGLPARFVGRVEVGKLSRLAAELHVRHNVPGMRR